MLLPNMKRLGTTLVYVKLFLIWLSCVVLDIVIGFRFELLWPLWLMVRHLYDANRVQTFASSFHYSAFSVFFVCITATSDLICYLFIPVQVLLFLASTYVWIQFVYQSTERGFCASSLLLWSAFVGFEYLIRSRLDQTTLYLTRGSWITAGMFSNGAESIQIGTSSAERLEVYRPFAAHCLGYPIVTLGFRVKSFFSSWRLKRRRRDVQHRNELFKRLLAEAVPIPLECRYHHLSSAKQQLALEHDQAEYELDEEESPLNGGNNIQTVGASVVTSQPTTFCYLNGHSNNLATSQNGVLLHHNNHVIQQRKNTRVTSTNGKLQAKQNVSGNKKKVSREMTSDSLNMGDDGNDDNDKRRPSITLFAIPGLLFRYFSVVVMCIFTYLLLPLFDLVCAAGQAQSKVDEERKSEAICDSWMSDNEAEKVEDLDESDKEFQHRETKRNKSKRRGRTPNDPSAQSSPSSTPPKVKPEVIEQSPDNPSNGLTEYSCIRSSAVNCNGDMEVEHRSYAYRMEQYGEEMGKLKMELKESNRKIEQLGREKEMMERALDGVRSDLLQLRSSETSLKAELTLSQTQEKNQKKEIQSIKSKLLETEQKLDSTTRQAESFRLQAQNHQQKLKKDKANFNAEKAAVIDHQKEINELKTLLLLKEKELKEAASELKGKQNQINKLEQKIRSAENAKLEKDTEKSELKSTQKQMAEMKQVIARLEKTLMSENRLKVDLFRALNDSKTQIETLTNQLRSMEIERIQNGFAPCLKADFMNAQLPSSLVASLAKKGCEDGSTNSSSSPAVSPVSSSPSFVQSMPKPMNGNSINCSDANDLEKILRAGGYSLFQDPAFTAPSTPSIVPRSSSNPQSSRCNSPSASELFSILNGTGPINLAGYGFGPASSQASRLLNGTKNISPTFH
ncbi:unnamed protein product [Bursaphelenchus xylophilus]|uniref:(pine wood nematode) hypothetical protein n=1 Tax=Bursaphelenchus xylophilus TaxID=6326 RepID=A0A7I8XL76_BURXY|nr:unnamed protein product [Bursaphelenchus xylophilus]CAG9085831.1 unnamed protein product [Bursaphelenchus xylophilus]